MSHEWHRGVLDTSSWHGLEEVGVMVDADGMITAGKFVGLKFIVDRSAGNPRLEIITEAGLSIANAPITASGNFSAGRLTFWYAPSGQGTFSDLDATVEYGTIYLGQTDGTGDPDYGFVGDASADGVAIFGEGDMAFTGTTPITPGDL